MYKEARKESGLTIEESAYRLHIASRTLCKYESGETVPSPEVALGMAREYKKPFMTQIYCKECCAIGNAYSYEVLNNVNLNIDSELISLQQEAVEAMNVLPEMIKLIRNKKCKDDFSEEDWKNFINGMHEWLDLEHNIVCLKIAFNDFTDVQKLVHEHNEKCIKRHYAVKEGAR